MYFWSDILLAAAMMPRASRRERCAATSAAAPHRSPQRSARIRLMSTRAAPDCREESSYRRQPECLGSTRDRGRPRTSVTIDSGCDRTGVAIRVGAGVYTRAAARACSAWTSAGFTSGWTMSATRPDRNGYGRRSVLIPGQTTHRAQPEGADNEIRRLSR